MASPSSPPSSSSSSASASASASTPTPTSASSPGRQSTKVMVLFRSVGDAPIMRQNKFRINADERFGVVAEFLRKQLHLRPVDSLFLFVSSAFSPCLDSTVHDLHQCFHVDGTLIVNYCLSRAWG